MTEQRRVDRCFKIRAHVKVKVKNEVFQVYIKKLSSANVALFLVLDISQKDCLVFKINSYH